MANHKPIYIKREFLRSEAFRSLKTAVAIQVLMDFLMKRQVKSIQSNSQKRSKEWEIINNGKIQYTYSEALKRGITKPRFQRALDELIEKGFIDIARQGGMFEGDKTLYSISTRWKEYGTKWFEKKVRPKDTRKGKGFSAYHAKKKAEKENQKVRELVSRKGRKSLVKRTRII